MTILSDTEITEPLRKGAAYPLRTEKAGWSRAHDKGIWPGLLLTSIVAAAAYAMSHLPGMATFSPMILVIGISFHNLIGTPTWAKSGVTFSLRRLLRVAIILLGLQLTIAQVIEVGGRGIGIIAATLVATFAFTIWMGRLLGVERKLAQLIADQRPS